MWFCFGWPDPLKKVHTVAQLVTQRWTDRWTITWRGCAGTSLWAQVNHACMFNLVMQSAMQAPPRYALKTSLLTRTTWTLACLFQNKLVWCCFWKHQYWWFLTCSFTRRPPAVVLSGQRDGQLPSQTTPRMASSWGSELIMARPCLQPNPNPGETTRVAQMSGSRGTDRKHGQVGSPDRKQEVM